MLFNPFNRFLAAAWIAAGLIFTSPLGAEGALPPHRMAGDSYTVRYHEVEVLEVLRFVSQIAGVNFIYQEEELHFPVTIISERPVNSKELLNLVLQLLQSHGFTISESQNSLLVYKRDERMRMGPIVTGREPSRAVVTRVFTLYNLHPQKLSALIEPMLSPTASINVVADSHHLVLTDLSANVEKVADLIEALDAPAPGIEIVHYEARHSDPQMLVEMAQSTLRPMVGESAFSLVRQPGTDNLFVVSTPYLIERTLSLFEVVDRPFETELFEEEGLSFELAVEQELPIDLTGTVREFEMGGTQMLVYKVQYHQGDQVKRSLIDIARSLSAKGGENNDLIQTAMHANWIEETNTLIFSGDLRGIHKLKRLLQQVDTPLKQVFIEVLVLRTRLEDSLEFGVDWGERSTCGSLHTGVGMVQPGSPLPALLNPLAPPDLGQAINKLGLGVSVIGRFVSKNGLQFSSLGALINAVETDGSAKVVINPTLLAQDRQTASIFVGDSVAFVDSVLAEPGSNLASQNISYRDVGTTLRITPLLGSEDAITLHIDQEIEETIQPPPQHASSVPTSKSFTKTRVHVPDGHFVILSGQIQQRDRTVRSGLPCLGGLPFLGAAFANTRERSEKENLIIFIRPHLIDTKEAIEEVTESQRVKYSEASRSKSRRVEWCTALRLLNLN